MLHALVGDSGGSTVKLPSSIRARSHQCPVPGCGVCMFTAILLHSSNSNEAWTLCSL